MPCVSYKIQFAFFLGLQIFKMLPYSPSEIHSWLRTPSCFSAAF